MNGTAQDLIADARVALAAASRTDGPVRVAYLAAARVAHDQAVAELRELEHLLRAREAALAADRRAGEQTPLVVHDGDVSEQLVAGARLERRSKGAP